MADVTNTVALGY